MGGRRKEQQGEKQNRREKEGREWDGSGDTKKKQTMRIEKERRGSKNGEGIREYEGMESKKGGAGRRKENGEGRKKGWSRRKRRNMKEAKDVEDVGGV